MRLLGQIARCIPVARTSLVKNTLLEDFRAHVNAHDDINEVLSIALFSGSSDLVLPYVEAIKTTEQKILFEGQLTSRLPELDPEILLCLARRSLLPASAIWPLMSRGRRNPSTLIWDAIYSLDPASSAPGWDFIDALCPKGDAGAREVAKWLLSTGQSPDISWDEVERMALSKSQTPKIGMVLRAAGILPRGKKHQASLSEVAQLVASPPFSSTY